MEKYCVYIDYVINDVIQHFQENKERVAVVLDRSEKVIGAISQGDIIRAFCKGCSVFARIEQAYNPSFLYLQSRDMAEAYKLFRALKITMIPVVDENFMLTDVIKLDDIYEYLEMAR